MLSHALITFNEYVLTYMSYGIKVKKVWSDIAKSGEVAVSGLSLGSHYFVCSIPNHCEQGNMRIKVNVLKHRGQDQEFIEVKVRGILKSEGRKREVGRETKKEEIECMETDKTMISLAVQEILLLLFLIL